MVMLEYDTGFVDGTGVGIDVFVEASQALVEPLEAFFNNVFVMAVSGPHFLHAIFHVLAD